MGLLDFIFGNKKEKQRLETERLAEQERQRKAEEARLAENRRKEAERQTQIKMENKKMFEENSKKYRILNFYLDCSHCREQDKEFKKCKVALPVQTVDIENEEDLATQYNVRSLPKLILVDYNGKELHRWKGITPIQDVNKYLYSNGYAFKLAIKPNSISGSKKYDANKIISKLKASNMYNEEHLMDKGLAIVNKNSKSNDNESLHSIVEALKLFIEVNKIVDSKKEDTGKTSPWKPKVLLYIGLCNYLIGNYDYAHCAAQKGLEAIDEAINDSYFTGIPRSHYGEKDLLDLIEYVESQHSEEAMVNGEYPDVDENCIDTTKLELNTNVSYNELTDDVISKEYIASVVKKYDALRMQLMISFMGGNKQSMVSVIMLHEFMAPIFYAWEHFGYGDMYDFWSEDQALGTFKRFKSSNILEQTKKSYYSMSQGLFPFKVIDKDDSLRKSTTAILKALIDDLE